MTEKESDVDRRMNTPPIPLDNYREALSAYRLNRATIRSAEPKRGGLR